jgi:hypothetical protein
MSQSLPIPDANLSVAFAQKYLQQLAPIDPNVDHRFLEQRRQGFAQELRSALRKKMTVADPLAIGYVAMQFHYTGVHRMQLLPYDESG